MNNNQNIKPLNGFNYRKHLFESFMCSHYIYTIQKYINDYFGYNDADSMSAGRIACDDAIIASIDKLKKDNMQYELLLIFDQYENIEKRNKKYSEFLDYMEDQALILDETHYTFKVLISPNLEETYKTYHFNDIQYIPFNIIEDELNNDEKILLEKIRKFEKYIHDQLIPELVKLYNNDVDIYYINGKVDEKNFIKDDENENDN